MKKSILLFITVILCVASSWACTSFIISGKATPTGRPMMFKHRDTGELNNRISHFQGTQYAFMGLVNSPSLGGEVWAGMNEAGLCIMNTASYNLREDELECAMDREGEFWSEEERQYLQSLFDNGTGITAIAILLQRTELAVIMQANQMDLFTPPVKSVHTVPESPTAYAATASLIRHSVPVINPLCPFRRYLNAK